MQNPDQGQLLRQIITCGMRNGNYLQAHTDIVTHNRLAQTNTCFAGVSVSPLLTSCQQSCPSQKLRCPHTHRSQTVGPACPARKECKHGVLYFSNCHLKLPGQRHHHHHHDVRHHHLHDVTRSTPSAPRHTEAEEGWSTHPLRLQLLREPQACTRYSAWTAACAIRCTAARNEKHIWV